MTGNDLPLGIQSFRDLRERGFRYVDKTAHARLLFDGSKHSFLSRPRRFGKSLFVDMLEELFSGNEELFRGLDIHPGWNWDDRHPVVRLDFGAGDFAEPGGLEDVLGLQLDRIERQTGLRSSYQRPGVRLSYLIEALHQREGRGVVLLVDEYDHPITDALGAEEVARRNREILRSLYAVTKSHDKYLRFSFFTGVSRFSRAGLFSGANNLTDLSLRPEYSAVCGYTEAELGRVFGDRIGELGLDRDEIRSWYNGYWWLGDEKVYNPYCILQLLETGQFQPWWWGTGTPEFLIGELVRRGIGSIDIDGMTMSWAALAAADIGNVSIEALMFQTGYLTIDSSKPQGGAGGYTLTYPNHEVRTSLNRGLLSSLLPGIEREVPPKGLMEAMLNRDKEALEAFLRRLVARVSYHWQPKHSEDGEGRGATEDAPPGEWHYSTMVFAALQGAGLDARGEVSTSRGRADIVVPTGAGTYLFEIKIAGRGGSGAAIRQIVEKGYSEGFVSPDLPVLAVGVEVDPELREIVRFDMMERSFASVRSGPRSDVPVPPEPPEHEALEAGHPGPDHLEPGDPGAGGPEPGDPEVDGPEPGGRGSKGPGLSM